MDGSDADRAGGAAENANGNGGAPHANARRILTSISSRSWEHPADRAALAALRKLPVFDEVLKTLFGFFGEKPIRLAFQANALRVSERQYGHIYERYRDIVETLDTEEYPLYVSQTPIANAGAYGMDQPFIILNSGTVLILNDDELSFILGHEVGHIMSGHVLYRTMMVLLIQLASLGFPIVGLAARAVLMGLLEWSRKSELSSDRAGLVSIQDADVAMTAMMKMAGGGTSSDLDLGEFVRQAEDYREGGDVADHVFKVLNLLGVTHPFWVLRLSEIRSWIESGEYDRIVAGEYPRRDDPDPSYRDDISSAADAYAEEARSFIGSMRGAARRMGDSIRDNIRR
ncbi:MAG: M48 family metallopeptidase [Gammaproteobacteria bacterium]|nr:M48 family metallopeptidase [Gammaproteobacteria bacterium]MDE0259236.1 M48 family metallopeptidase [Gammaproteobacteria bacterium]